MLPIPEFGGSSQSSAKYKIEHLFNVNSIEKTTIKRERPIEKTYFGV